MEASYRVLVAEDEKDLRDIMKEILEEEGYACDTAKNGSDAVNLFLQHEYDLLITDFQMPLMNGAELLFWCRKHGYHFPVLFVSANTDRLPVEELALGDCCASLLNKPVAMDVLLDAVAKAKSRQHRFDCEGKTFPRDEEDEQHFPGQHI